MALETTTSKRGFVDASKKKEVFPSPLTPTPWLWVPVVDGGVREAPRNGVIIVGGGRRAR